MKKLEIIIKEILENDNIEIKSEMLLIGDLGFDSLRFARLIAEVEEKYFIEISDEEFSRIQTVQDILMHINKGV